MFCPSAEGCRKEIGLSPARRPARGAPEAALPGAKRAEHPRGGERDPHRPSPRSYGEAVSPSGGILFVEKQVTVEEGLRERANRSPCAGLITALRRFLQQFRPCRAPAEEEGGGGGRGRREPRQHFPVSRFFSRHRFLLLSSAAFFQLLAGFSKGPSPACCTRHAAGSRAPSRGWAGGDRARRFKKAAANKCSLKACTCRGLGFPKFAPTPASLPALLCMRSRSTV